MKLWYHGPFPDWCHLCGKRKLNCIDIFYPKNAEYQTHNTQYIRICGECAKLISDTAKEWVKKEKWVAFFRGDEGKIVCVHGPCLLESYKEAIANTDEDCPDPIKVTVVEKEE